MSYIPLQKRERSCLIEGSVALHTVALKARQLRLLDHKISDNSRIIKRLCIYSQKAARSMEI